MIIIVCPICEADCFFQHFYIDSNETVKDLDVRALSMSHLLAVTVEEAPTAKDARRIFDERVKKLEDLKKKYIKPVGVV